MPGTNISAAEVTHVSVHGFWLLLGDEELLLPFPEFPWFRQATIEQLTTIEWPSPDHLYWPLLDVDLSVASIRHPENFPLVSAVSALLRNSGADLLRHRKNKNQGANVDLEPDAREMKNASRLRRE